MPCRNNMILERQLCKFSLWIAEYSIQCFAYNCPTKKFCDNSIND